MSKLITLLSKISSAHVALALSLMALIVGDAPPGA